MRDPKALGMVLAILVGPGGKPVRGGSLMGQLHASPDGVAVLRQRRGDALLGRAAQALLVASVIAVVVNLFTWRSGAVLWGAVVAQGLYWVTLPRRRRALEPEPLTAAELEEARRAGRVALQAPGSDILRLLPPERPQRGLRRPARIELPAGALEIYLSDEQFRALAAALGRDA